MMYNNKKNLRKLKASNYGVAGVLTALLLIGLFISILAFVQTVYVPQWMEQREAEHMDQVANQFNQLKYSVDTLSIICPNTEQIYSPISNPITLGNKEMPFLTSIRTYGSLDILPNDFKIIIENSAETVSYSLGSLRYSSHNAYYLDQSYVYENGALILSQSSGDMISVEPAFLVTERNKLVFNLVKLSDIGEKVAVNGYGTYPIQTRFSSWESLENIHYVENITIISSYKNAWKTFFNEKLPSDKFNFTINETVDGDGIVLRFSNETGIFPVIDLSLVAIDVQISHGWVEQS